MAAKPEGMTTAAWKKLRGSIITHENGQISEKDNVEKKRGSCKDKERKLS